MKKIIALITALAITISAFSGVMIVVAESDELTPEVTEVTIDGQRYKDGITCHNGSIIEALLTWNVSNLDWDAPDGKIEFTYYLGNIQLNDNQPTGGNIPDPSNPNQSVGTWSFDVTTGEITITLYELNKNITSCWVQFKGIIPLDPVKDKEGEAEDLYFGDEKLNIIPSHDKGGNVNVSKSVGVDNSPYYNEADGTFVIKNKIIVTVSDNYVSNINLKDELQGADVEFPSGFGKSNITVSYKPVDENPDPNSDCVDNYTLNVNGKQFDMTLPGSFAPGDVIEVTYDTVISMKGMAEVFKGNKSVTDNSVSGKFTDIKDSTGEKPFNDTTSKLYSYSEPSIKKYGAWQNQENGIIKWTITFDPGVYGDIDKYINDPAALDKLGIKNLTENLGSNQKICDAEGNPREDLDLSKLTLGQFEPANSWDNTLTFEFYTKADTTKSNKFSNDVSINVFNTAVAEGSASVEIKDLDIQKTATNKKPNDDGTMDWKIQIYVPYGKYNSITVIDTPKPDENKSGYTHSVVEDSIKIENDTVETAKANGVTFTSTPKNGVKIVLPYSYVKQYIGQYITITLKTKVEKNKSFDADAFAGSYKWTNEALYYTDDQNKSKPSNDDYEKSEAELTLTKHGEAVKTKGENGYIDTTIAEWRIDVSNFAKCDSGEWVGSLFSEKGLTLDLTDTLPDHMEYVKGSAYAVPYLYVSYYDQDIMEKYKYVDRAKELFSQGLNIVNNGDTLTIKWSADAALKQELQNFITSTELVYDTYTSPATLIFSSGTSLSIYYRTQLKEKYIDDFIKDGYTQFTNKVSGDINGKPGYYADNTFGISYNNESLAKETPYTNTDYTELSPEQMEEIYGIPCIGDWLTSDGVLNVPFKIDVNPQRLSLGGTLFVEDTMGESLELIEKTVVLTNMDTGEKEKCKFSSTTAADGKTTWVFEMPDGVHYKLTYFCKLNAKIEGTTVAYKIKDSSNSVQFHLHGQSITAKSNTFSSVKFPRSGATTITPPATPSDDLKLIKVDEEDKPLSGAKFEFEVYTYDSINGELKSVSDERSPVPSSDGSITYFAATDPKNEIYKITETTAPTEYQIDKTAHYYVCEEYNATLKAKVEEKYGIKIQTLSKNKDNKYEFTFTNQKSSSQPKTAEADLTVTKEFKGGTLEAGQFKFQISLDSGDESGIELPSSPISNDENGKVNFGKITFNKSGIFKVKIEETETDDPTIIYDLNPRYITYTVDLDAETPVTTTYGDGNEEITDAAKYLTFTNILTSSLKISKMVTGDGAQYDENEFKFTVTLKDTEGGDLLVNKELKLEIKGSENEQIEETTTTTDENGQITFILKNGRHAIISGIPVGAHYDICENNENGILSGYSQNPLKNTGNITSSTNEVLYTNVRIVGSLSIRKTVENAPTEDNEKRFKFTVKLTDKNKIALVNQTFDVEWTKADSNAPKTVTTNGNGEFTVDLSDDQTITIKGLPEKTHYTVEETPDNNYDSKVSYGKDEGDIIADQTVKVTFVNKYKQQSQGTDTDDGSGDNSPDNNSGGPENTPDEPDGEGGDGDETSDSNGSNSESEKEPSFDIPTIPSTPQDTTKPVGGSLTVSKTVAGDGAEADREFTFTIEFKNADGTVVTDYFSYGGSKSGTIKSGDTFTLKHGESITITNLPDGVIYNVSEVETDGYISKSTDSSGIVYAGQSHSASFVNEAVTTSEETTTTVAFETCYGDDSSDVTESSVTVSESSAAESTTTDRESMVDGYGDSKDKIPNTANKGDKNIMFMFISLAAAFTGTTAILIRRKKSR